MNTAPPLQSLKMADHRRLLSEVKDSNGNTALHLLCRGNFDRMLKLLRPHVSGVFYHDMEQHAAGQRCGVIAEMLLDQRSSTLAKNNNDQTPVDVLLSDFHQVYCKRLTNMDYVRILNVFLEIRYQDDYIIYTLCKREQYMLILRHFITVAEKVNEDVKQFLVALRNIHLFSLKHIVETLIQKAANEPPNNIVDWFSAVVDGVQEYELRELFRDSSIKKHLMTLLKGQRENSVLSFLKRWHLPESGNTLFHEFVAQGDADFVTAFLALAPSCINVPLNDFGRSPLFCCRDEKTLALLHTTDKLQPGVVDNTGQTALMYFANNGLFNVGLKFLQLYPDLNPSPSQNVKDTVFFSAVLGVAKHGRCAEAIMLLKAGHTYALNINHQTENGNRSALMKLIQKMTSDDFPLQYTNDCKAVALYLMGHKDFAADLVDVDYRNVLMYTVDMLSRTSKPTLTKAGTDIFAALLQRSTESCFNFPDKDGRNVLIYAITELVNCTAPTQRHMMENAIARIVPKTDVNATDSENRSALMHAVLTGSVTVVKCLLDNGADPNLLDKTQETAASYAVYLSVENLSLLLKVPTLSLSIPGRNQHTLVHTLAHARRADDLMCLLETKDDINLMAEDHEGNCPVYLAIQNDSPMILVQALIRDRRFKILFVNSSGTSVIDVLEEAGKLDACQSEPCLVEKFMEEIRMTTWCPDSLRMARKMTGIQKAQDKCRQTALMYAIEQKAEKTSDMSLLSPETFNLTDKLGQSVIHYMLDFKSYCLLLPMVLDHIGTGACDIYARDNSKTSAVLKATLTAPINVVEAFFKHPTFDVMFIEQEPTKRTFDVFADRKGVDDVTKPIYDLFVDKLEKEVRSNGWDGNLVKMFLKVPLPKLDTIDNKHGTALNYALMTKNMKLALDIIHGSSTNVNHKGSDGNTPLITFVHWLKTKSLDECHPHEQDLLDTLLAHTDIDVNLCNNAYQSALLHAIENRNDSIIEHLLAGKSVDLKVMPESIGQTQRYKLCEYVIEQRNTQLLDVLLLQPTFDLNATDCSEQDDFEVKQHGTSLLISIINAKWKEALALLLRQPELHFNLQDGVGLTPLMHAIQVLPADEVRKMLNHPNCSVIFTNRFDQNAVDKLDSLLKQRKEADDNERSWIKGMINGRAAKIERHNREDVPKNKNELKAALERTVGLYKAHQRDNPWTAKDKDEVDFLIHICVENISAVSDPDRVVDPMMQHQRKFMEHYARLQRELDIHEPFLAHLTQSGVLTSDDCAEIQQVGISRIAGVKIILRKLMFAGANGYQAFQDALRGQQDWLLELVGNPDDCSKTVAQYVEANVALQELLTKRYFAPLPHGNSCPEQMQHLRRYEMTTQQRCSLIASEKELKRQDSIVSYGQSGNFRSSSTSIPSSSSIDDNVGTPAAVLRDCSVRQPGSGSSTPSGCGTVVRQTSHISIKKPEAVPGYPTTDSATDALTLDDMGGGNISRHTEPKDVHSQETLPHPIPRRRERDVN